ncbi:NmrA-like family protein [Colletotrichum scovillei]|uniref:NmrA-like family protein n=1 Tax=Colletotrichum scovillei TaxID=1209932 RepID=A0A9P7QUR8_9PEZI|nr:NmrA-like family protein [Colletotrichum scovillei]KAG7041851.1 NmrA-like family protein [Colletotrichum scovillei]KAG7061881.1 NmrA-like family protein [Colletotrichum scovillei]
MAVAIAGGISGPGRALVEAISAQGTHEIIVLTRKVSGKPGGAAPNVRFVAVDYSDIDSLTAVLEKYNVDTVISTVNNNTRESHCREIEDNEEVHTKPFWRPLLTRIWSLNLSSLPCIIANLGDRINSHSYTSLGSAQYLCVNISYDWKEDGHYEDEVDLTGANYFRTFLPSLITRVAWLDSMSPFFRVSAGGPRVTHPTDDRIVFNDLVHLTEGIKDTKFSIADDST